MIIDLDSVGKVAKAIVITFDPAEIDLEGEDATLRGKTEFAGESQRVDGKAHIRGTIRADLSRLLRNRPMSCLTIFSLT